MAHCRRVPPRSALGSRHASLVQIVRDPAQRVAPSSLAECGGQQRVEPPVGGRASRSGVPRSLILSRGMRRVSGVRTLVAAGDSVSRPVVGLDARSCAADDRAVREDLPTGTVTFLFTDVEGSTRLLDELGARGYGALLAEHHRACREAWAAHGGVEIDTAGDAFFVAFSRPSGALAAAADAQHALALTGLAVRMGVHTGELVLGATGYVGIEVHRAARICSAGHGGQVLISQSTRELVEDELPDGVGAARPWRASAQRTWTRPQRLSQLLIDGLRDRVSGACERSRTGRRTCRSSRPR